MILKSLLGAFAAGIITLAALETRQCSEHRSIETHLVKTISINLDDEYDRALNEGRDE